MSSSLQVVDIVAVKMKVIVMMVILNCDDGDCCWEIMTWKFSDTFGITNLVASQRKYLKMLINAGSFPSLGIFSTASGALVVGGVRDIYII